jgi:chromosome segregation ATPase
MAIDTPQSKEIDLDRTDKLPILQGVSIDDDVEDDSVRLDYSAQSGPTITPSAAPEFSRPAAVDLPSLAESVRSVEERIARQNADYEALKRQFEKAREAQLAAGARADALASDLAASQAALAVERHRVRDMEQVLTETRAATDATRGRVEEALRDSERAQTEARTLRDSLTTRDETIAQVMHSLGERDAQLHALQREHAQVVPALEARSRAGVQLESDLQAARGRAEALDHDLKASRQSLSELMARLKQGETELHTSRRDLTVAKARADAYLETLRTRVWRGGFNQNLFLEWDQKEDAARSGRGVLQAECDQLKATVATLNAKVLERDEKAAKMQAAAAADAAKMQAAAAAEAAKIQAAAAAEVAKMQAAASTEAAKMQAAAAADAAKLQADAATLAKKSQELQESQRARAELHAHIDGLEADRKRLEAELEVRGRELGAARVEGVGELQRVRQALAAAEAKHAEQSTEIEQLQAEAVTHEEEMTVLMAHLQEARRPVQSVQADIKRLSEELALKTLSIDQLAEENRNLRTTLERTRGALEERELLIRRLERSASTNANALGRLQTSIERLGAAPAPAAPATASEFIAELVRLDGDQHTTYPLARRTRIGRTPGCEMQIDSQSVSRNHAMLLKGARELIVEDLNSTNGVLVNGRKVSRQVLSDGDVLTIGETQFRCVLKFSSRPAEAAAPSVSELRPAEAGKSIPLEAASRAAGPEGGPPPGAAPVTPMGTAASGPPVTPAAPIAPPAAGD